MSEDWLKLKQVLGEALELDADQRPAYLDGACGSDLELRRAVERLLERDRDQDDFMTPPPMPLSAPAAAEGPELPFERLGGYRLLRRLGHGGSGVVYLADQEATGKRMALKVLSPWKAPTAQRIERFRREASSAAKLLHPGIVRVHGFGEQGGFFYLVMDYVDGPSLAQQLKKEPRSSRFAERAAEIVRDVALALQHAHEHGVVHRDVKPQNILIGPDGAPQVTDFGLAKDQEEASLTRTGEIEGTPNYMSPEQVAARKHLVDHRTDVYSLGVVLYELLTGARPFEAPTAQQILHNISSMVPRRARRLNPSVPVDLETICHKAMERRPAERYATARDLAEDLQRFLDHLSIHARPPSLAALAGRWARRRRAVIGVAALIPPLLLLGGWFSRWSEWRAEDRRLGAEIHDSLAGAGRRGAAAFGAFYAGVKARAALLPRRSAELEQQLGRLEAAHGDRIKAEEAGLAGCLDGGVVQPDKFLTFLTNLSHLGVALTEDKLDEYRRRFLASLRVELTAAVEVSGARIRVFPFDPATGDWGTEVPLAADPARESVALPPGLYRVQAELPGYGFCELTRWLRAGELCLARGRILPTEAAAAGMILVPASGEFQIKQWVPTESGGSTHYAEFRHFLSAFYIDRDELTLGEYWTYLEEARLAFGPEEVPVPYLWQDEALSQPLPALPAEYRDLPVTGIAAGEARRCAEWLGKRLPGAAEWRYAARGPEYRITPTGEPLDDYLRHANAGRRKPEGVSKSQLPAWLAENLRPAAAVEPWDAGPFGLRHTLGNAEEWTDSPVLARRGSGVTIVEGAVALGGSLIDTIAAFRDREGLSFEVLRQPFERPYQTGFRCAKSAAPRSSR